MKCFIMIVFTCPFNKYYLNVTWNRILIKIFLFTAPVAFTCYLTTNYFVIIICAEATFSARYVENLSIW